MIIIINGINNKNTFDNNSYSKSIILIIINHPYLNLLLLNIIDVLLKHIRLLIWLFFFITRNVEIKLIKS